ncbi:thiamine-phosphate kinase [Pendulispora albinea]|uniref:Thiamine-monophosphate kinase n=1 Tax=Pendulispora albinea TaxID=2741071 RepID=A0ABZ2LT33_9BACT
MGVLLGIGDDAAVLDPSSMRGNLVWTIDEQVERTHFRRDLAGWIDIGWRSFMSAASDLAAMGAEPWCALSALSLPADFEDEDLDALARGQHAAALRLGTAIVGGNLTRGEVVTVTTTLLGTAERPVLRDAARPGDDIWIAGRLGLAAAGLFALDRGLHDERLDGVKEAWLRPWARIGEGRHAAKFAHALVDVSDGLAQDVGHVGEASGVRALFDENLLRDHAHRTGLESIAELLVLDPLELMLTGGEDYALIAASDVPLEGFWRAGTFVEGQGVALKRATGRERELFELGYDHFRARLEP